MSKTVVIAPMSEISGETKNPVVPIISPSSSVGILKNINSFDAPNQLPLPHPPVVVKGIYLTGWSGGLPSRVDAAIKLVERTELNAVVVDIKDYSGNLSYKIDFPFAVEAGAFHELRIMRPNAMIKKFHDAGVYVIGRITVFQDPILAKAHPEWALKNAETGAPWKDRSGLEWIDPAARQAWDYAVAIAKDALARGFDEINFDYVRFASDGDLSKIEFPFWDKKTPRHKIISDFFSYLRDNLAEAKLSADLFGLASVNSDDLGIGQVIEDAYAKFDAVSPMVYPSHFASGFLGYQNPAAHPREVVEYSMSRAFEKLLNIASTTVEMVGTSTITKIVKRPRLSEERFRAKLRPWLQDFDLGARYDAAMVKSQMDATYAALGSSTPQFGGWLLWNPANIYTETALEKE